MELSQDFKEFIESLNASRVRYLVVGGYAVAMHGHPQFAGYTSRWHAEKLAITFRIRLDLYRPIQ